VQTNAGFAVVKCHSRRTHARGAKRRLQAEMTASKVVISAQLLIYTQHTTDLHELNHVFCFGGRAMIWAPPMIVNKGAGSQSC